MTFRTLIRRSLRFHWRAHLGVVLGGAVGSAALIGALVVGDSVRESLREKALASVGHGSFLLYSPDRYFSARLSIRVRAMSNERAIQAAVRLHQKTSTDLPSCINPWLPERSMLIVPGTVSRGDGAGRMNHIQVIGVTDFAPVMLPAQDTLRPNRPQDVAQSNACIVNQRLSSGLGLRVGDSVVIRIGKARSLPSEAAISPRNGQTAAVRLTVRAISTNGELANFSSIPTMNAPANIFVPLTELASLVGVPQADNRSYVNAWLSPEIVRLVPQRQPQTKLGTVLDGWRQWLKRRLGANGSSDGGPTHPVPQARQRAELSELLRQAWNFGNAQIARVQVVSNLVSLTSDRVFLDPPLVRAAKAADTNCRPILTYLANLLRAGTNATPYSMVTAAGAPYTPADMRDDEMVVNQWLAEDLQVKAGDKVELTYFVPESGAHLIEATNTFRVRGIVPMELPWADRTLMPEFPGIEKAESTRDWDAGFPLVHKIRPKDEDYWKQYRGTPKAFVTLAAGQRLWGNRFGNLTAIRFPIPSNNAGPLTSALSPGGGEGAQRTGAGTNAARAGVNPLAAENYREALEKKILATLKPEELGLRFEPVREQALRGAEQGQDFGQLFLGFSMFLIVAALLLMGLLFQLGLEQRMTEVGTLLALGFRPKQVRRLLLGEGVLLAVAGGLLGTVGGIAYARAMLHGLTTVWRDAVGASVLGFHATGQTLVLGLCASVVVSAVTIWLTLHRLVKRPARELLEGEVRLIESKVQSLKSKVLAIAALVAGLGLVGWAAVSGETANAGAFFGAGALVLIAGLSFVSAWLGVLGGGQRTGGAWSVRALSGSGQGHEAHVTWRELAVRGCGRRRKRSLATVAMLACGSFLIVAIGVFRLDANRDAHKRTAGTGGFALMGETTLPVVQDLNTKAGRDFFALSESDLSGVRFVPFRVHEGDEASCLNLNRAQRPRLLGVKPELLEGRFAFVKGAGWKTLRGKSGEEGQASAGGGQLNAQSSESLLTSAATKEGEIPAIGDANAIEWALHKKVGDTLDYVDEHGRDFKLRLVGAVANSILQGSLIIDEAEFVKRFPGESGYRLWLIDAPADRVPEVSATLARALLDVGLGLTPAATRLAQFNAVQNTYLGTFQVLGGLGLLLGSVGLGIVVLRNVLERRGELALLLAVGFRAQTLRRLLLIEHGALLGVGLALGMVAAVVAVVPALMSPGAALPYVSLGITLGAVLANGAVWTWGATRLALRGNLLSALRNE